MTQAPVARSRGLLANGAILRTKIDTPATGGGPKYEPQTAAQASQILYPRVAQTARQARQIPNERRLPDRLYVEAELLPNYISASDYPEALLARIGAVAVGSRPTVGTYRTARKQREAGTRRLILSIEDASLAELGSLIANNGAGRGGRTEREAFEEIRKLSDFGFAPREATFLGSAAGGDRGDASPNQDEPRLWEAILHPLTTASGEPVAMDEEGVGRWTDHVLAQGGEVISDYVRRVGGLTFVPVFASPEQAGRVADFNPLRAMRPMPSLTPVRGFGPRSTPTVTPPATPDPIRPEPQVAIFDGGVDTSSALASLLFPIATPDLTPLPANHMVDHGTGVTGAALYGLLAPGPAPQIPLPTESFRVLPAPAPHGDLNGYWVLDEIKKVVETGRHKIVNLSIGPEMAVEDAMQPDRWTAELDLLAWEHDVLFVVAAGNNGQQPDHLGLHRVQVPGDMVNGLTVGACDQPPSVTPWARASYSAMGPGRAGCKMQPLGVQFGGDASTQMFPVLTRDGSLVDQAGTSFAAPVQAHAVADLTTRLPQANPSILRAFAAHFAERPKNGHKALQPEVGHGRFPLSYADHLDCGPDQITVLFADEISRGELAGYRLPVPAGWASRLQLRLTLAYASPVEPAQPTEYTQASIDMTLRPDSRMHSYNSPSGSAEKPQKHDSTSPEAANLRNLGWKESQDPIARSLGKVPGSPEIDLRDSGKWETVRHHRLTFKASAVHNPRLDLSFLARRAGSLHSQPATVPFAVLVTFLDPEKRGDLFDTATAQFGALRQVTPLQTQIQVQTAMASNWH